MKADGLYDIPQNAYFISKVDESNQDRSLRKKTNFVQFWDQFNGLKNNELKKVLILNVNTLYRNELSL